MLVGDVFTFGSQILDDVPLMHTVPGDNSSGDEGEATGSIALALKVPVTNAPQAVKANSALKGVLRFAAQQAGL